MKFPLYLVFVLVLNKKFITLLFFVIYLFYYLNVILYNTNNNNISANRKNPSNLNEKATAKTNSCRCVFCYCFLISAICFLLLLLLEWNLLCRCCRRDCYRFGVYLSLTCIFAMLSQRVWESSVNLIHFSGVLSIALRFFFSQYV